MGMRVRVRVGGEEEDLGDSMCEEVRHTAGLRATRV